MKTFCTKVIGLVWLLACLPSASVFAQYVPYSNQLSYPFYYDTTMDLFDDACEDNDLMVALKINHNCPTAVVTAYQLKMDILVTRYDGSQPTNFELVVNYDPLANEGVLKDKDVYYLTVPFGDPRVAITQIYQRDNDGDTWSVVVETPANVVLDAVMYPNCVMDFYYNLETEIVSIDYLYDETCDESEVLPNGDIQIVIERIQGAEYYELEWTFVNDYAPRINAQPTTIQYLQASNVEYDFKGNATRVVLDGKLPGGSPLSYVIPNVYDHGYLVFRYRGVGRMSDDPTFLFPGPWRGAPQSGNITNAIADATFHVQQPHEPKLNWQVTTTFAEGGKKKEVISYFDGSQRNRQTVTRTNTNSKVIVGETIYDFEGRPTVNILPVPLATPTDCAFKGSLQYHEEFNVNVNGAPYSYNDFDFDHEEGPCDVNPASPLGTSSGAAKYYSANNTERDGAQAFVPDAMGYPYTQVEYTADNTGRIRNQGGVGQEFQIGSGHETKYFYGRPSQLELDRMFASEVGKASHYQKNMVVDPNGQVSVSYLDMEGRTIATALAGNAPANLIPLGSLAAAQALTVFPLSSTPEVPQSNNIINEVEGTITFSDQVLVVVPGCHQFRYELTVPPLAMDCVDPALCFNCLYTLEMSITDDCGNVVFEYPAGGGMNVVGRFQGDTWETLSPNFNCSAENASHFPLNDSHSLMPCEVTGGDQTMIGVLFDKTGKYTVSKVLRIYEPARQAALDAFMNDPHTNCDEFEVIPPVLTESACDWTCAECAENLGSVDEFVANTGGTPGEWQVLYDECMEACNYYESPCGAALDMMLSDVSKGGQYGSYTTLDNGTFTSTGADHALSVFNITNMLPQREAGAHWQNPYNPFMQEGNPYTYINSDGTQPQIFLGISETENGEVITPEVRWQDANNNGLNDFIFFNEDDVPFTYPQYLEHLDDFLQNWDDNWAYSLVSYHPEFCYYEMCLSWGPADYPAPSANTSGGETEFSSAAFDRLLANTETVADAIAAGLLNSNGQLTDWLHNNAGDQVFDPFMAVANSSIDYAEYADMMISKWNYFYGDITMAEAAAQMVRCPAYDCENACPGFDCADCQAFGQVFSTDPDANSAFLNHEWQTFKGIYISVKQGIQKKYADEYVIRTGCYAFNECIGEENFAPQQYPNFLSYGFPFPSDNDHYFDAYEPCGVTTHHLYETKTPRFPDANDIPGMENASNYDAIGQQMLDEFNQCPMDLGIQMVLGAVAAQLDGSGNGGLDQAINNLPLTSFPEFSGLLTAYFGTSSLSCPIEAYDWSVSSSGSGQTRTVVFEGAEIQNGPATITMTINDVTITWADIIGMTGLHVTSVSGNTYYFHANGVYTDDYGAFFSTAIAGQSDVLPIGQCSFAPTPTPGPAAAGLVNMMNTTMAMQQWSASQLFDINTNNTVPDAPTSVQQIVNGLGSSLVFTYVSDNTWKIKRQNDEYPYLKIVFTGGEPTNFDMDNFGSGYYLANMNTNCDNLFVVDLVNASTNQVFTQLEGYLDLYTASNSHSGYPIGECGHATSFACLGDEFEVQNDLFNLIRNRLVSYNGNVQFEFFTTPLYTQDLQQQAPYNGYPDWPEDNIVTTANGAQKSITFRLNKTNCNLTLTTMGNETANFNFVNITEVLAMVPQGEPDENGNYQSFILQVTYRYAQGGYYYYNNINLSGQGCWDLQFCACEALADLPNAPTQGGTVKPTGVNVGGLGSAVGIGKKNGEIGGYTPDLSVQKWNEYKSAVSAFNSLQEHIDLELQIQLLPYKDFQVHGLMYTSDIYMEFLASFDPGIHVHELLDIMVFAKEYGNYLKVDEEYLFYVEAIEGWNSTYSSAQVALNTFSVFTFYMLASSVRGYMSYLLTLDGTTVPQTLLEWAIVNEDQNRDPDCVAKYQEYVNAYQVYNYIQTINPTCEKFRKVWPLLDYKEFLLAGLCCEGQTVESFSAFIQAFYDPSECPQSLPSIVSCDVIEDPVLKECNERYAIWYESVKKYNDYRSSFGDDHRLNLPDENTGFNEIEPYCDCIADYINYLEPFIGNPNLSLQPMDLVKFPSCEVRFDPCDRYYASYYNLHQQYNTWIALEGNPFALYLQPMESYYTRREFGRYNLCQCFLEWRAFILSVMAGTADLDNPNLQAMLDINRFCHTPTPDPCDETNSIPAIGSLETEFEEIDCDELDDQNAANALENINAIQYTAHAALFLQQYNQHCLHGITERLRMIGNNQEYHYTLYYYDQAGNLVKTVPPEGVELLPMYTEETSINNVPTLYGQVQQDRLDGSHTVNTTHRMATRYEYNSLNQLVRQLLPDHDPMDLTTYRDVAGLPQDMIVTDIQMITTTKGYATGYIAVDSQRNKGLVFATENGGSTWQRVYAVENAQMEDIVWMNNDRAIAVGQKSTMYCTSDAGANWYMVPYAGIQSFDLYAIAKSSATSALAVGAQGAMYSVTWNTADVFPSYTYSVNATVMESALLSDVTFDGTNYIITASDVADNCVNCQVVWKRTTGGSVTALQYIPGPIHALQGSQQATNTTTAVVGADGQLYMAQPSTGNNPVVFKSIVTGQKDHIRDAYFLNSYTGIALFTSGNNAYGKLKYTKDGGLTWHNVLAQTNNYKSIDVYNTGIQDATIQSKVMAITTGNKIARVTCNSNGDWSAIPYTVPASNPTLVWSHRQSASNAPAPAIAVFGQQAHYTNNAEATTISWNALPIGFAPVKAVGLSYGAGVPADWCVFVMNATGLVKKIQKTGSADPVVTNLTGTFNDMACNAQAGKMYLLKTDGNVSIFNADGSNALCAVLNLPLTLTKLTSQGNRLIAANASHSETRAYVLDATGCPTGAWLNGMMQPQELHAAVSHVQHNKHWVAGKDGDVYRVDGNQLNRMQTATIQQINDMSIYAAAANSTSVLCAANEGKVIRLVENTGVVASTVINAVNGVNVNTIATANNRYMIACDQNVVRYKNNLNENSAPTVVVGANSGGHIRHLSAWPNQPNNLLTCLAIGSSAQWQNITGTQRIPVQNVYGLAYNRMHFSDTDHGTVVGNNGMVKSTDDGGVTWKTHAPAHNGTTPSHLYGVLTTESGERKVVGQQSLVGSFASDGIYSYQNVGSPNTTWTDIAERGVSGDLVIIGNNGAQGHSQTKVGNAWIPMLLPASRIPQRMDVVPDSDRLAAASNGGILILSGNAWSFAALDNPSAMLKDVDMYDQITAFVCGEQGYTRKLTIDGLSLDESMQPMSGNLSGTTLNAIALTGPDGGITAGVVQDGETDETIAQSFSDLSGRYSTFFYYDRLGRIVASQNSKQHSHAIYGTENVTPDLWSYSLYDLLGRVYQAGQKQENTAADAPRFSSIFGTVVGTSYNPNSIDDTAWMDWIGHTSGERTQVTTTTYDVVEPAYVNTLDGFEQRNPRKRVTSVCYEETYDTNPSTYQHATHYSYDIHGNVDELMQDNPSLATLGQQFKRLAYTYDLISGNVHEVRYQEGQPDQFTHRYTYDADNRITDVYTTKRSDLNPGDLSMLAAGRPAGAHWDHDAAYFYYDHGPLARTELGDNQVQGIDYAYTLQGWLKGTNSSNLSIEADMGGDSRGTSVNRYFAQDAASFSLHYFQGDYLHIGGNASFLAADNGSYISNMRKNLWNGNIGSMWTNIADPGISQQNDQWGMLGMVYGYDQLNRLVYANGYNGAAFNATNSTWSATETPVKYHNSFTYDANGNIFTQLRADQMNAHMRDLAYEQTPAFASNPYYYVDPSTRIDQISYGYERNSSNEMESNRLYQVTDAINYGWDGTADNKPGDIYDVNSLDQDDINYTNNYGYTAIGELERDDAEGIERIEWRVDSKISYIYRDDLSGKQELGFDYDAMGNRIAKHVYSATGVFEKSTYYVRDASGNVMATYEIGSEEGEQSEAYRLIERPIYGSSRIGLDVTEVEWIVATDGMGQPIIEVAPPVTANTYTRELGHKQYEVSNHLGNVLVVVNDIKMTVISGNTITGYRAQVISATDYSPFGVALEGRAYSSGTYRFGFQAQEQDAELWEGAVTYKYRVEDPRLGRFFSVDPLYKDFPWNSNYAFSENKLIDGIELEGLEHISVHDSGIDPCSAENSDGTYTFNLGETTFENVKMEVINGVEYFDIGKHMSYGEEGWSDGGGKDAVTVEIWYYMWDNNPAEPKDAGHSCVWDPVQNKVYENHFQTNDKTVPQALFDNIDFRKSTKKAMYYSWDLNSEEGQKAFMAWRGGREELLLHPVVVPHPDASRQHFQQHGKNFTYNLALNNCKNHAVRGLRRGGSEIKLAGPFPKNWVNSDPVFRWEWDSGEDCKPGTNDDLIINIGKK